MTGDKLRIEYDEEITALRAELVDVEDHIDSDARSRGLRARIRDLQFERDLIPTQDR